MTTHTVPGRFFDGKSATAHDVLVEPAGSHLNIFNVADKSLLKRWSYNEIKILEEPEPPQPVKITSTREPDARLHFKASKDWQRIRQHLPKSAFPPTLPVGLPHFIGYAAFSIVVLLGAYFYLPYFFEASSILIPKKWEQKLGEMAVTSIIDTPVCNDPEGRKALDKIMRKLGTGTNGKTQYAIEVADNPETMNALSAPGARLILFSGIIEKADTPEEVAGVLAHEIAHGELRHPTKGLTRSLGFSLLFSAIFGDAGNMSQIGSLLGEMSYNRADELAADAEGQNILIRAQLNPKSITTFFERLQKEESKDQDIIGENKILNYLSTHPLTAERIARLNAKKFPAQKTDPLLTNREWNNLKKICETTSIYAPINKNSVK
ncbi:MAG: M48 family metallopeptidase [Alphaproteobacteria bacterium]